ncbi:His Phos 1 domain containing protein [Trichuris trichiura]|uniref:Serine/threonine-protein phosphatase PGAM5, mitochondrial n=1 Tax=Trichuris trichiura TaxID=36087 RepID=A0A077ZH69_TRITR|nr:His Phos 1 domain containing protein [Trichuris trichiura]
MFRRAPVLVSLLAAASKTNDDSFWRKSSVEPSISQDFFSWDPNWDKRDPEASFQSDKLYEQNRKHIDLADNKTKKNSISRNLFFVRHGEYYTDGKDKKLTDLGRKQAELCAERLFNLGFHFTRFVSSEKQRAVETANIMSQFMKPDDKFQYDSLLNEGCPVRPDPNDVEIRSFSQSSPNYGPRIEAAFRRYFYRPTTDQTADSYEIFVCHANVIRYFVCRALQIQSSAWRRMSIANCSITWIKISQSGRVNLRSLGDTGFMPANMITY